MSATASPIVETTAGRVAGTTTANGITVFRGVPYGASPAGARRFRMPTPPTPWTGVRDSVEFGPAAQQRQIPWLAQLLPGMGTGELSEDCLSLNVWTPGCDPSAQRPVMVWIHGGAFTIGSGAEPWYEGSKLARRGDVVVVSINYRLGIFGFAALAGAGRPELVDGAVANAGLHDQVAALRWVGENVAAFGGDPANVTIFGESAGAMSVSTLLAVPSTRGLFHRAIAQSGAAHHVAPPDHANEVVERMLHELELERDGSLAIRLREMPVERLLDVQLQMELRTWSDADAHHLAFCPVVDGHLLPEHPLDAIRAGSATGVALLAGSNRNEWNLFQFLDPDLNRLDDARFVERCEALYPGHGPELAASYVDAHPTATPWQRLLELRTDWGFRVPAIQLLEAQAAHSAHTYRYEFAWSSPAMGGMLGACHALELPFVFDTHDVPGTAVFTGEGEAVDRLTQEMQDAWIAFARTGNPNHDGLEHWPSAMAADGRPCLVFDETVEVDPGRTDADHHAFWRRHR